MENRTLLTLKDLSQKDTEGNLIYEGISFTLNRGECLHLKGNSGSGKSSLCRHIAGIPFDGDEASGERSGELIWEQENIRVGFVFQDPHSQLCCFRVVDELIFGLENLQLTRGEITERLNEYVERFNLHNLLEREVYSLSGGEKQLVALCANLMMKPDLIILDEVSSQLDPWQTKKVYQSLSKEIEDNKELSLIIIEHKAERLHSDISCYKTIEIASKRSCEFRTLDNSSDSDFLRKKLAVNNLTYRYSKNDPILFKDFSEVFESGEIVSIVGKNGAGKSTLARLICGLIDPTEGEVIFNNISPKKGLFRFFKNRYVSNFSYVFQNPECQFLTNSVEDELKTATENEVHFESIGLQGLENHTPFELSLGQQRRLSVYTSILLDRDVYILDEPTYGQDASGETYIEKSILDLKRNGKLVFIISHDFDLVKKLSDRVVFVDKGKIDVFSNDEFFRKGELI